MKLYTYIFIILINSATCFGKYEILYEKTLSLESGVDFETVQSLDKLFFKTTNYKISSNNPNEYWESFGSKIFASFKTKSIDTLEEFAFVQFVRGCYFTSTQENGSVIKTLTREKLSFAERVVYHFPKWIIDSEDTDPVFLSPDDHSLSRHFHYLWQKQDGSFVSFGEEQPYYPELIINNRPVRASYFDNWDVALNASTEFKLCLYKTSDIPLKTTADDINFAKAIYCYSWNNSIIYDHETNKFQIKNSLDSFCLK